jgi:hypothetical protein
LYGTTLRERPHPRGGKGKDGEEKKASSKPGKEPKSKARHSACAHCNRLLQTENCDFCSIACKVRAGADMRASPASEAAARLGASSAVCARFQIISRTARCSGSTLV